MQHRHGPAERKALEAVAITLYRLGSGRSPAASFGRMPRRLPDFQREQCPAGGGWPALPRRPNWRPRPVPPACRSMGCRAPDPASCDWMGWAWSPWAPVSRARLVSGRDRAVPCPLQLLMPGWYTSARESSRSGSGCTRRKPSAAGHCQGPGFSGDLEASWVALPGLPLVSLLEHENDLIAAHVLATGHAPAAQFLG